MGKELLDACNASMKHRTGLVMMLWRAYRRHDYSPDMRRALTAALEKDLKLMYEFELAFESEIEARFPASESR